MDVYHLRGYRYRHFSARFVNVLCTNSQFVYIMNKQKKKKKNENYTMAIDMNLFLNL